MSLTLKQRYARLDMSKLPKSYTDEFDTMEKETEGFTDDELNAVFEENFNDLYELVEKKHPGAIRSGGTVVKEKPGKVKVVKAKEGKLIHEYPMKPPSISKEEMAKIDKRLGLGRKKLTDSDIEFIEKKLVNDDASTDAELVMLFVSETGISKKQAEKWVSLRNKYENSSRNEGLSYSERKAKKKAARKGKDEKTTLDGFTFNQKDPAMKGKKFYDVKGKVYTCKGYNEKSKECTATDEDGKEMDFCLESYYAQNPVTKREKGNLIDDCKDELKKAGYTVKEHQAGKKKIKRSEPRPEKVIIKERVEETFTPIMKDLKGSDAKNAENKEIIAALEDIQALFTKFMNRISNLADDGKLEAIKKIQKLLKEIVD
jgi:predicted transcriptional regulator